MPFPPGLLDRLRSKVALVPLIGRRVRLVRSGKNWAGCCPFHDEKTPSFYVYDDHFHCFGCGAHGDAIAFIMQAEGAGFEEAVIRLASEAGLTVPGKMAEAITLDETARRRAVFRDGQFDSVLGAAARLLVQQGNAPEASILANGSLSIRHWEHDNWNGGQDMWRLFIGIPAESYHQLADREGVEKTIEKAIGIAIRPASERDFIEIEITTALENDPDWRQKTRQALAGRGINNQGRVHSQNVAARTYDNLLFRSDAEICMYRALKEARVAFAPLSVVVGRDGFDQKPRRIEPDFVIYKDGLVTIVEVDGDNWHTETPEMAHWRLKFLLDEGLACRGLTPTHVTRLRKRARPFRES